ncbi:LytTR family transcriptional regulator DNA-binding domain-containing protein [Enterococcus lactis]|nr:LytTR family transcriptional regulator DNA-binding domain-containing protein [Enterococcus lactis]MDW8524696.1 LytTR family transcriptional regulator DNA-binding domain-containing protein [Enterococcus lactis]
MHKVEALDFIQKKSEEELKPKIIEVINTTVDRISKFSPDKREFILIRSNYTDIKLVIDDILFFETTPVAHKLSVHLLNRQLEFYANIKDISAYNSAFYRCHQSTVVNINNIEVVNTKTKLIQMIDGQKCNVSVRYLKGLLFKLKEKQKTLS